MKHNKMFWSPLSRHLLRTAGFLAVIFFMTAHTWGQTPMPMPQPTPTPPMTNQQADDTEMGDDDIEIAHPFFHTYGNA